MELRVRNVHHALPAAIELLGSLGIQRESRNGPVLMFPELVTTIYERPSERVLFWQKRDANPFFHLFEALWMLDGRNDLEFLTRFVKNFGRFSDDGKTLHGAYGHRWRRAFGWDQLKLVAERLKANKDDRRQVIQMFDVDLDLVQQEGRRDIPCNLTITVQVNPEGALDLSVFNRSNDLIWGCYGANAVHFSVLQEFLAAWIGVPVGRYAQASQNLHAYLDTLGPLRDLPMVAQASGWTSPYERDVEDGGCVVTPLVKDMDRFHLELHMFMECGYSALGYTEPFFRKVAIPMLRAHDAYSDLSGDRHERALRELENMPAGNDWQLAAREWLMRRKEAALKRSQGENHAD